ncbi:MAG: winged helix-turn-helix domain-containing protein, partial [Gammaproteobacteria bacterium]
MKVMANDRDYPVYEFGPFRLDTAQRALLQGDKVVPLWPKALDALLVLVQNSGRILEKDFLLETIWPDSTVEENNLAKAISEIRKALGERPQQQRYIVTVAGRGYRFAASVKPLGSGALAAVGSRRAESEDASAGAAPSVASIAVLPFICLGTNGDDGFLAVGMADALITRLGNLRQIV